jgi:acyl-CoA thioesterase-1
MVGGMAGPGQKAGLKAAATWVSATAGTLTAACLYASALAQTAPEVAPLPRECEAPGAVSDVSLSPLPHITVALKERRKIKILAIGGTSASLRGPVSGGHFAVVEQFLETTFKGLDVEVVHRGVSGELAASAAQRIKTEVALTSADLVLWQVGTSDALARVPIPEIQAAVTDAITWLKAHNVDVIVVGLRYARSMAGDTHYQATRAAVRSAARALNVMRISRYEAEETLEKIRRSRGVVKGEVELTEASYVCMAEYLARAIAAGIFVKDPPPGMPPARKEP